MAARLVMEDFLERNRCRIFVKTSEHDKFTPVWDSLQVVGCATPADANGQSPAAANSVSNKHYSKYYIQFAVHRRTDYKKCLGDLFHMSLRKERRGWLLLWVLVADRRFLAHFDADKTIMQGALMHRAFWLTVREDARVKQKRGSVPDFRYLQSGVAPLLHCMPDRMLTVSLMWVRQDDLSAAEGAAPGDSGSGDQGVDDEE